VQIRTDHYKGNNGAFDSLVQPSVTVITELNQQLEQWRCHLPPTLQFSSLSSDDTAWDLEAADRRIVNGEGHLQSSSPRANLVGHLRARYCAAKSIIYRPFAFKVLHFSPLSLRNEDYDCLRTCLLGAIWIPVASRLGIEKMCLLQNPLNPCRR